MIDKQQQITSPKVQGSWFTRNRMLTLLLIAATVLTFYLCYRLALPFLPAIIWAVALAVVTRPLHDRITRHIKNSNLAAGLAVLILAVTLITPGVYMTRRVVKQAGQGLETLKTQTEAGQWRNTVENSPRLAQAVKLLEPHFDVRGLGERAAQAAASRLSSFVGGSVWVLAQILITFFTLFYLFRDRRAIVKMVKSFLPLSEAETDRLFSRVGDTIYATFYGTFAVAIIQGVLGGLMFWWLGLPAPLLWGVVMTIVSLIPVLGAPGVWLPAAVFLALSGSWGKALILTGWGLIVIGSIDNLLYPVLVGDRVRMHTLLIFFSVLGGIVLFGAVGLVLGPVAVVFASELREVWRERTSYEREGESGVQA